MKSVRSAVQQRLASVLLSVYRCSQRWTIHAGWTNTNLSGCRVCFEMVRFVQHFTVTFTSATAAHMSCRQPHELPAASCTITKALATCGCCQTAWFLEFSTAIFVLSATPSSYVTTCPQHFKIKAQTQKAWPRCHWNAYIWAYYDSLITTLLSYSLSDWGLQPAQCPFKSGSQVWFSWHLAHKSPSGASLFEWLFVVKRRRHGLQGQAGGCRGSDGFHALNHVRIHPALLSPLFFGVVSGVSLKVRLSVKSRLPPTFAASRSFAGSDITPSVRSQGR